MAKLHLHAHQWHHTIADFDSLFKSLQAICQSPKDGDKHIHLLSEMVLAGYPLQDLILQKSFIQRYQEFLARIHAYLLTLPLAPEVLILLGGPIYHEDQQGLVKSIENGVYKAVPGQGIQPIYRKMLLPNYDIFDEKKYFSAGRAPGLFHWQGHQLGILICEDMWASSTHDVDPVQELIRHCREQRVRPELLLNLSASPFHLGKAARRLARAREISRQFDDIPFIYVNRVGGEDEILFDGQSFALCGDRVLAQAKSFALDSFSLSWDEAELARKSQQAWSGPDARDSENNKSENTWEAVYGPRLDQEERALKKMSDEDCRQALEALQFGLQEYASKCGMKHFLVALSGGIDSGLVLTIAQRSLKSGQTLEAIYMPGQYSASLSWELCQELCRNLKVPLKSFNIKFLHGVLRNGFAENMSKPLEGLADENIQSRLRGLILYTRSNQTGAMVINTSNKSEIAVGYSTQYGDSVGALSLLGDLYKTEVYQLCDYINRHWNKPIPESMITRPPTAELRDNQTDQDSLPPYPELDAILEGLISYRYSPEDLIRRGHHPEQVGKTFRLYQLAEYKRFQFCPIIKIHSKSFGFGHRVPIAKTLFKTNMTTDRA